MTKHNITVAKIQERNYNLVELQLVIYSNLNLPVPRREDIPKTLMKNRKTQKEKEVNDLKRMSLQLSIALKLKKITVEHYILLVGMLGIIEGAHFLALLLTCKEKEKITSDQFNAILKLATQGSESQAQWVLQEDFNLLEEIVNQHQFKKLFSSLPYIPVTAKNKILSKEEDKTFNSLQSDADKKSKALIQSHASVMGYKTSPYSSSLSLEDFNRKENDHRKDTNFNNLNYLDAMIDPQREYDDVSIYLSYMLTNRTISVTKEAIQSAKSESLNNMRDVDREEMYEAEASFYEFSGKHLLSSKRKYGLFVSSLDYNPEVLSSSEIKDLLKKIDLYAEEALIFNGEKLFYINNLTESPIPIPIRNDNLAKLQVSFKLEKEIDKIELREDPMILSSEEIKTILKSTKYSLLAHGESALNLNHSISELSKNQLEAVLKHLSFFYTKEEKDAWNLDALQSISWMEDKSGKGSIDSSLILDWIISKKIDIKLFQGKNIVYISAYKNLTHMKISPSKILDLFPSVTLLQHQAIFFLPSVFNENSEFVKEVIQSIQDEQQIRMMEKIDKNGLSLIKEGSTKIFLKIKTKEEWEIIIRAILNIPAHGNPNVKESKTWPSISIEHAMEYIPSIIYRNHIDSIKLPNGTIPSVIGEFLTIKSPITMDPESAELKEKLAKDVKTEFTYIYIEQNKKIFFYTRKTKKIDFVCDVKENEEAKNKKDVVTLEILEKRGIILREDGSINLSKGNLDSIHTVTGHYYRDIKEEFLQSLQLMMEYENDSVLILAYKTRLPIDVIKSLTEMQRHVLLQSEKDDFLYNFHNIITSLKKEKSSFSEDHTGTQITIIDAIKKYTSFPKKKEHQDIVNLLALMKEKTQNINQHEAISELLEQNYFAELNDSIKEFFINHPGLPNNLFFNNLITLLNDVSEIMKNKNASFLDALEDKLWQVKVIEVKEYVVNLDVKLASIVKKEMLAQHHAGAEVDFFTIWKEVQQIEPDMIDRLLSIPESMVLPIGLITLCKNKDEFKFISDLFRDFSDDDFKKNQPEKIKIIFRCFLLILQSDRSIIDFLEKYFPEFNNEISDLIPIDILNKILRFLEVKEINGDNDQGSENKLFQNKVDWHKPASEIENILEAKILENMRKREKETDVDLNEMHLDDQNLRNNKFVENEAFRENHFMVVLKDFNHYLTCYLKAYVFVLGIIENMPSDQNKKSSGQEIVQAAWILIDEIDGYIKSIADNIISQKDNKKIEIIQSMILLLESFIEHRNGLERAISSVPDFYSMPKENNQRREEAKNFADKVLIEGKKYESEITTAVVEKKDSSTSEINFSPTLFQPKPENSDSSDKTGIHLKGVIK